MASTADTFGDCPKCGSDDLINDGFTVECAQCGHIVADLEEPEHDDDEEETTGKYECTECGSTNTEVLETVCSCSVCKSTQCFSGDITDEDVTCEKCEEDRQEQVILDIDSKLCRCRKCGEEFAEQM